MRVCVFGAGPVGLFVAAQFARSGAEVSMVARGPSLAAIRNGGIRVQGPGHDAHVAVRVADDPAALGPQDAVITATKAYHAPAIVAPLSRLCHAETAVVFLQNGIPWWYFHAHGGALDGTRLPRLDPGDGLWDGIGPQRAIGGVIFAGCDLLAPGVVAVETPNPTLFLGEPDGSESERVRALAAAVSAGSLRGSVSTAIRATIWGKLQMNICSGLLGCLANAAPRDIYGDPGVAAGVGALVEEVGAIASALGCATGVDAAALLARTRDQRHKSSIVADLERGRPIEFDSMFGIPRELGERLGIATPTLSLLSGLVQARARISQAS